VTRLEAARDVFAALGLLAVLQRFASRLSFWWMRHQLEKEIKRHLASPPQTTPAPRNPDDPEPEKH
jgi:hypothetical protein